MSQKELISLLYEKYNSQLLNKKEASRELNISEGTIDNLRKAGDITGKKVSGQIMFTLAEIARFLSE